MAVQPKYHWTFEEGQGNTTVDVVSGQRADLIDATWSRFGRIGRSVTVHGNKDLSRLSLGAGVGVFGTSDFTIAFGMRILDLHGQNDLIVIGNRGTMGHSNFFSIRIVNQNILNFAVDEDEQGKNHVFVDTAPLPIFNDGKWHHVTAVREGRSLKLYIDGALAAESVEIIRPLVLPTVRPVLLSASAIASAIAAASAANQSVSSAGSVLQNTGIANITNTIVVKLGRQHIQRRRTPTAQYEDLRIYYEALDAVQVRQLIPPVNRLLQPGEIELVATDDGAIILTQDTEDLNLFSPAYQKLRVGPKTGVTLYQQPRFDGVGHKLYADLPEIRTSKLGAFPQSVRIWSTDGEPFTGKWVIKAPDGQYLSWSTFTLATVPHRLLDELFTFHYNLEHDQPQLIPATDQETLLLKASPEDAPAVLLVDDTERPNDAFSMVNDSHDQWLKQNPDRTFSWTEQREDRAIFFRAAKMADNEGQVGELLPGEVALYQHAAYAGRTWILSDSEHDVGGNYTDLRTFDGLNDQTSSIRVGPATGATLFANAGFAASDANREREIEDIVADVPDLRQSQVGNDVLSSLKIFRTIPPEEAFSSFTSKLSQDYRMVNGKLEEFSAYRTTLRFAPDAGEIEVSATDLTTIEVDGTSYEIDEVRSVTLSPNVMHRIMITSEADGINSPGLKIRTRDMAANERVVIFPDQEVHRQIAELEDDALWNATDANGNLIVDRKAHSQADVASIQSTITKMMATTTASAAASATGTRAVNRSAQRGVGVSDRPVFSDAITSPFVLSLQSASTPSRLIAGRSAAPSGASIQETAISQSEFEQFLGRATSSTRVASRGLRDFFRRIKDAVKKAVAVVVGVVKQVIHVIVETVEEVVDFVVDTVEKVVAAVEGFIEKVIETINEFIEFLRFAFDWDDILATQRYLVSTINSGFDFATQLVVSAKKPVEDFLEELKVDVEEGANGLIRALGGEPSEVRTNEFQLPEAAEWFLTKVLGGLLKSPLSLILDLLPGSAESANPDSPLTKFVSVLLEAFEDSAGIAFRVVEGLFEGAQALIENPSQPQRVLVTIIEALRDVGIQTVDLVEDLALGFLDVVAAAIQEFQRLLNEEINIPLISDLFELVGAGPLTLLNLTGVLLAIPVTVLSKIAFNEAPFQGASPLDFSNPVAGQQASRSQAAARDAQPVTGSRITAAELEAQLKLRRNLGMTAIVVDIVNGVITAIFDGVPESGDEGLERTAGFGLEYVSVLLDFLNLIITFPRFDINNPGDQGGGLSRVEILELTLWFYRMGVVGVDGVIMVASHAKFGKAQRLKRLNFGTAVFFTGLMFIDAALVTAYLVILRKDEKPEKVGLEIASETLSMVPNLLGLLRTDGTDKFFGSLILAAIDTVVTGVTGALAFPMLEQDLKALKEASEQAG